MSNRGLEPTVGVVVLLIGVVGLYGLASAYADGGSIAQIVTITKALGGIFGLALSGGILYVFTEW